MKKMKKLLLVLCSVMLIVSLNACSSNSEAPKEKSESSVDEKEDGKKVEIVYLHSHGDLWEGPVGQDIISKFENLYPNITVKLEAYPFDQMIEMVEVKMKSKLSDFDVFNVDAPLVTSYSVRGYIDPIENYVSREELEEKFTETAINSASYEGVMMSAPKRESGMIMVYNKSILKENGIEFPSNDVSERMSWEECLEIAKKVTKITDGTTETWGIVPDQINRVWNIMPMANSTGARWLSDDGFIATGYINSEESIKAMTFYQDLFNMHGVAPKGVNTNEARELFDTGKVAFIFGDPSAYSRAVDKGLDVGVCPVPAFEDGIPAVGADSWHAGVNAYSKHKEEAAEFIKYMTMGEGSDIMLDSLSNIGPRIDRMNEIIQNTDDPQYEVYTLLNYELQNNAFSRPKTPGYNEWADVANASIEDIRNGSEVKQTLDNAAERIDRILEKYSK